MENYIGCKIIKAKKVKFSEYLKKKHGEDFKYTGNQDLNSEVYLVIYPPLGKDDKPYISMSPVDVFETAYRKIDPSEESLLLSNYEV